MQGAHCILQLKMPFEEGPQRSSLRRWVEYMDDDVGVNGLQDMEYVSDVYPSDRCHACWSNLFMVQCPIVVPTNVIDHIARMCMLRPYSATGVCCNRLRDLDQGPVAELEQARKGFCCKPVGAGGNKSVVDSRRNLPREWFVDRVLNDRTGTNVGRW